MLVVGGVAGLAGLVNAIAGGGTLLTFPVLLWVGLPPIAANITNTVALCPGYLGGTLAQWQDLKGQGARLRALVPVSLLGGVAGGGLLLYSGAATFMGLIPGLILFATGLLASQNWVKQVLQKPRAGQAHQHRSPHNLPLLCAGVGLAAIYGGYFGPGLSVIFLAILGTLLEETLVRLNALKQLLAFSTNTAVALFFIFSGQIVWPVAIVMALGALLGGALGGKLANRLPADLLRQIIVGFGVIVALVYWIRA
jgi:uncharacterized protein